MRAKHHPWRCATRTTRSPTTSWSQAVLAREPAAWPTFFAKYERLVISCIRKVMRRYGAGFNEEDLEDLVSATALNIVKDDYKKLRAFDATRGYKLSCWIGLIATNTAHDALRRRAPTEVWAAVALDDTAPVPLASETTLASEALEAEDEARELRAADRAAVTGGPPVHGLLLRPGAGARGDRAPDVDLGEHGLQSKEQDSRKAPYHREQATRWSDQEGRGAARVARE